MGSDDGSGESRGIGLRVAQQPNSDAFGAARTNPRKALEFSDQRDDGFRKVSAFHTDVEASTSQGMRCLVA